MRKLIFSVMALLIVFPMPAFAGVPFGIAGFRLGADIKQFEDRLRMDTVYRVRQMEYLSEVEAIPPEGYKSGYITFGNCDEPGRIVKIKMKYEREDEAFFKQLLELFKDKFGEPCEYKGDPFRSFISWKWSFRDENNNLISLTLQHNSSDEEEYTSGNSMKMSISNLID